MDFFLWRKIKIYKDINTEQGQGKGRGAQKAEGGRRNIVYSHFKDLIEHWVEGFLDGFGLPFDVIPIVRYQLELDVRVAQPVGVHRDEVTGLNHCRLEGGQGSLLVCVLMSVLFCRRQTNLSKF